MDLSSSQLARQELSRALRARVTLSVPARTCRVAQCVGLGRACAFRGSSEGPLLSVYGWFFEHLPGPYQDGIGREVSTVWTGYDLVLSRLNW